MRTLLKHCSALTSEHPLSRAAGAVSVAGSRLGGAAPVRGHRGAMRVMADWYVGFRIGAALPQSLVSRDHCIGSTVVAIVFGSSPSGGARPGSAALAAEGVDRIVLAWITHAAVWLNKGRALDGCRIGPRSIRTVAPAGNAPSSGSPVPADVSASFHEEDQRDARTAAPERPIEGRSAGPKVRARSRKAVGRAGTGGDQAIRPAP
jgi:hypothetical protein